MMFESVLSPLEPLFDVVAAKGAEILQLLAGGGLNGSNRHNRNVAQLREMAKRRGDLVEAGRAPGACRALRRRGRSALHWSGGGFKWLASYNLSPFGIRIRSSKSNIHWTNNASTAAGMAP